MIYKIDEEERGRYQAKMIPSSFSKLLIFVALVTFCENMKNLYTDAILRLCNPALAERKFSTFATQFIHKNKILSPYSFRRVPIYGLNIKFHQKDAYSPTAIYDGKVADDFIRPNEKLTKKFILVSGGVISGIGQYICLCISIKFMQRKFLLSKAKESLHPQWE